MTGKPWVAYGDSKVGFDVPEQWNLLEIALPKDVAEVEDVSSEVEKALRSPISSRKISEIVTKESKVAIISDCVRRPTPANVIIPVLLDELNKVGVPDQNVKVIIGRGLNPPLTQEEFKQKVGDEVLGRVEVAQHDPDQNLVHIGDTSFGTPIWVNRDVMEADVKIGVGSIGFHEMAGYGGGGKIILPGVSGRATITRNHLSAATQPAARISNLQGNPAREEIEEAARRAGLDLKIDVVLNRDNRIAKVFAGDFVEEHRMAVKKFNEIYALQVSKLADVTITSSFPYDTHDTMTWKAFCLADFATADKGTIILVSPCCNGIREPVYDLYKHYHDLSAKDAYNGIKSGELVTKYGFNVMSLPRMIDLKSRKDLIYVTEEKWVQRIREMGFVSVGSLREAIEISNEKYTKSADLRVVPFGGTTLCLPP